MLSTNYIIKRRNIHFGNILFSQLSSFSSTTSNNYIRKNLNVNNRSSLSLIQNTKNAIFINPQKKYFCTSKFMVSGLKKEDDNDDDDENDEDDDDDDDIEVDEAKKQAKNKFNVKAEEHESKQVTEETADDDDDDDFPSADDSDIPDTMFSILSPEIEEEIAPAKPVHPPTKSNRPLTGPDQYGRYYATGRRKTSSARVWIKEGSGK